MFVYGVLQSKIASSIASSHLLLLRTARKPRSARTTRCTTSSAGGSAATSPTLPSTPSFVESVPAMQRKLARVSSSSTVTVSYFANRYVTFIRLPLRGRWALVKLSNNNYEFKKHFSLVRSNIYFIWHKRSKICLHLLKPFVTCFFFRRLHSDWIVSLRAAIRRNIQGKSSAQMVRFSKTFSSAVLLLLVMQSADCVPSRHGRE